MGSSLLCRSGQPFEPPLNRTERVCYNIEKAPGSEPHKGIPVFEEGWVELRRQLIVYRAPEAHCWMVKAINDPEVERAFGGEDIASAFTPQARAEDVQREIQRLNPECTVSVLEKRLYVWQICEFVAKNPETREAAALRDFVLSLCFASEGVNLEILFRVISPKQKRLVLQALDVYATVGKTQEVLVCGQWMNVLEGMWS